MVSVRDIVDDVDAAIAFYCQHLGFREQRDPAPTFAMLVGDKLRLLLSSPGEQSGGGHIMPDGTKPAPGGWNGILLRVSDLEQTVAEFRQVGMHFRRDIVTGVGSLQILLDDPSRNPVELFQPTLPEAASS